MAGDAYQGIPARCDCNLGGRVASSGLVVWITPRWVVASRECMGGPCGPRVGAVADHLIRATDFLWWMMRLFGGEVGDGHVQQLFDLLGNFWAVFRGMGFLWGVHDREVGVVRKAHQGGEEGVGRVGRVILFDCDGQGECHQNIQEGPLRSSLGDPTASL